MSDEQIPFRLRYRGPGSRGEPDPSHQPEPDEPRYCQACGYMIRYSNGPTAAGASPCEPESTREQRAVIAAEGT